MEKTLRALERVSKAGGALSGFMMIASVLLVLTEIVVRTGFGKTLYIAEEYSGYLMAGMTFIALAYTLKDKSHIRMVFLHSVLKGRARILLDVYAYSIGFVFCSILTWTTFLFFWDSILTNSRSMQISETPLAIPQVFLPLGSLLLALQFAAELAKSILRLAAGRTEDGKIESETLGR